ncbi:SpoIIE family protein phosphatase [Streptomyces sp. NPDC090075]|uniref:SpoIIE family protein phosphatase n=1 Tax=Streptomyces sp. NPDC090075 TaxID=3365937 RepID=UPI00381E8777
MTVHASDDQHRPGYGAGRNALLTAAVPHGHGLVVHHFGTRDILLEQALCWAVDHSIETVSLIPASGRLEGFAASLADFVAGCPDLQAVPYELKAEASRRPEPRPHVDMLHDAYRRAVREALACFRGDEGMTETVFAALEGLIFQQVTSGDIRCTREGTAALRQLLAAHRAQPPSVIYGSTLFRRTDQTAPAPRTPGTAMTRLIGPQGARPEQHGASRGLGRDSLTAGRASAVLDDRMRIIGWSAQAEALFGYTPSEVLGRCADEVLADTVTATRLSPDPGDSGAPDGSTPYGIRSVRHRDGASVPVAVALDPLTHGVGGAAWLVVAMDVRLLRQRAIDRAMLDGLHRQSPIQLVVYDTDSRVRWINKAIEKQFGVTLEEVAGRYVHDILPEGVLLTEDGGTLKDVERPIRQVLRTGEPVIDIRYRSATRLDPDHDHVWSLSYFLLQDESGHAVGVCEAGLDITDRYVTRQRLALLSRAGGSIGRTLDIQGTAEDLARLVVPDFADTVTVDLLEPVLNGQEPPTAGHGTGPPPALCRMAQHVRDAASDATGTAADALNDVRLRCLSDAAPVTDPVTRALAVPLTARGAVLGAAVFQRAAPRDPFDTEETALAGELVSRTAVCVDNARRYAREHATALTLQRDLLPRGLARPAGVEVAHRYLPTAGPSGVGGDWYDVIPLSGARVGLVVGDVAGHGLGAAATMGRLRTTVSALAALDLPPDELLARLDDLVARPNAPQLTDTGDDVEDQALGVTCLYAIYDPVSRTCVLARAGHPQPVLVMPDRHAETVEVPAGPPLGLGGLPFESVALELPEGSTLALFTNGLVESRARDIDLGVRALCDTLSHLGAGPLEDTCAAVVGELLPRPPEDDAALLLVRVHALPEHLVATWDIPADPGEVARARMLACRQLAEWDVPDEAAFVVELVVSELVTNAIRYGGAPVQLRLIRERGLIVEVSDSGHTSPHLRRAATEDEGGRGLFLVAQLTERWGTRYTPTGKTIWTETPLTPPELPKLLADDALSL